VLRVAFANGRKHRGVLPNLRMTSHAGVSRRHSSRCCGLYTRVTVATVNS
jgi:hypothetical protein